MAIFICTVPAQTKFPSSVRMKVTHHILCTRTCTRTCTHSIHPHNFLHVQTFERLIYPDIWTSHDGAPSPPAAIKIDLHLFQKTIRTVFDPSCRGAGPGLCAASPRPSIGFSNNDYPCMVKGRHSVKRARRNVRYLSRLTVSVC